jgi:hypothetical protein
LKSLSNALTQCLPKDPVPPVIMIDLSLNIYCTMTQVIRVA